MQLIIECWIFFFFLNRVCGLYGSGLLKKRGHYLCLQYFCVRVWQDLSEWFMCLNTLPTSSHATEKLCQKCFVHVQKKYGLSSVSGVRTWAVWKWLSCGILCKSEIVKDMPSAHDHGIGSQKYSVFCVQMTCLVCLHWFCHWGTEYVSCAFVFSHTWPASLYARSLFLDKEA